MVMGWMHRLESISYAGFSSVHN